MGLSLLNTFLSPLGAMPAAMTRDNNEIAQVNSYGIFCSNVGGMFISFGVPFLVTTIAGSYTGVKSQMGWLITLTISAIAGFVGLLFGFFSMKEHYQMSLKDTEEVSFKDIFTQIKYNKSFAVFLTYLVIVFIFMTIVNSAGSYYVTYNMQSPAMLKYFNLLATLPSFILVPLFPWLKRKMGRRGLMIGWSGLLILGLAILFLGNPKNIFVAMLGKLFTSMGMIVVTGYMWALEPEVVNYGEWKLGKRENAIISSVSSFAVAFGMALGGVIPGYVLKMIGFNAKFTEQSEDTLHGILMMQSVIPIFLILISIVVISQYPINDTLMNKMNKEIDARKISEK